MLDLDWGKLGIGIDVELRVQLQASRRGKRGLDVSCTGSPEQ